MKTSIFILVPARSGSKGLVNKNTSTLGGISLLKRAVLFARSLNLGPVVVSTDSFSYFEEVVDDVDYDLGLRSSELSGDYAQAVDVMIYEWERLEKRTNQKFDYCLYLEPTSPFRYKDIIRSLIKEVVSSSSKHTSGFTATFVPKSYHPDKIFRQGDDGLIYQCGKLYPSIPLSNRHEAKQSYLIKDGMGYITSRSDAIKKRRIISEQSFVKVHRRSVVNIDNWIDLLVARELYSDYLDSVSDL